MKRFRIGSGVIAVALTFGSVGAVSVVTTSTAAHAASACDVTTWTGIVSAANNNWVSAELGYQPPINGMLRARATSQGPWEKFQFVTTTDHHIAIKSLANNKFITPDLAYPTTNANYGVLLARASVIGAWEKFDVVPALGCALRNVQNGRYVSVELGYQGTNYEMLRARATSLGPWEMFVGTRAASSCANPFRPGESWGLGRTDRGVDYYAYGSQPVRAICDGTILSTYTPGWPKPGCGPSQCAFLYYRLSNAGDKTGKCIYQAEYIRVAANIHAGSVVHAGDVLGYASGDNEWGWAKGQGAPSTPKQVDSHGNEVATDGGRAFARFLRSLGAPTRDDPGAGAQYAGASC